MNESSTVCWDCFKYRTDVTPYKYFQGTYDEWLQTLPPISQSRRVSGTREPAAGNQVTLRNAP